MVWTRLKFSSGDGRKPGNPDEVLRRLNRVHWPPILGLEAALAAWALESIGPAFSLALWVDGGADQCDVILR